jgi:hypothetical protein
MTFQSNINSETSYGQHSLGDHQSTMELMVDDGSDIENGSATIEWDIPSLGETEHIGLVWEDGKLTEFDGVFSLPEEAAELMEHYGVEVDRDEFC